MNTFAEWPIPKPGHSPYAPIGSGNLPFWRRWLGDEGIVRIVLREGATEDEHFEAAELFPEARVHNIGLLRLKRTADK